MMLMIRNLFFTLFFIIPFTMAFGESYHEENIHLVEEFEEMLGKVRKHISPSRSWTNRKDLFLNGTPNKITTALRDKICFHIKQYLNRGVSLLRGLLLRVRRFCTGSSSMVA